MGLVADIPGPERLGDWEIGEVPVFSVMCTILGTRKRALAEP